MVIKFDPRPFTQGCQSEQCTNQLGCSPDTCPDFTIKRHDTKPAFKVALEDCDGPLDLAGLVVEVNMWATARLRHAITQTDTVFSLADNIGFSQIMIGDIIIMDRIRSPEYMLVTGFDEDHYLVQVQRGYRSTNVSSWKKGARLRIFRTMNAPAQTELVFQDLPQVDGTVIKDQLTDAFLVYEWKPTDTCLPGCYWLEFKVLKMQTVSIYLPGGHWIGPFHRDPDNGSYYTGSSKTESSVRLSYDGIRDLYLLPTAPWTGAYLLGSDNNYYTGIAMNDGSVLLNRDGHESPVGTIYPNNISGISVLSVITDNNFEDILTIPSNIPSIIPSVISPSEILDVVDPTLAPSYYGCILGEGVEWVRRFPLDADGFLVQIIDTPTREF